MLLKWPRNFGFTLPPLEYVIETEPYEMMRFEYYTNSPRSDMKHIKSTPYAVTVKQFGQWKWAVIDVCGFKYIVDGLCIQARVLPLDLYWGEARKNTFLLHHD